MRCYYLFPTLAPEAWVPRTEIKKMMKKALNEDKDFAEKIRKLQSIEKNSVILNLNLIIHVFNKII